MTHASTPPSAKLNFLRIIIFTVRLRQTGILTPSKPHWQAVVPFEYIRVQFGIDSYIHRSKSSNWNAALTKKTLTASNWFFCLLEFHSKVKKTFRTKTLDKFLAQFFFQQLFKRLFLAKNNVWAVFCHEWKLSHYYRCSADISTHVITRT